MLIKYDFHEYILQRHKFFIVGSEIFSSLLYCYMCNHWGECSVNWIVNTHWCMISLVYQMDTSTRMKVKKNMLQYTCLKLLTLWMFRGWRLWVATITIRYIKNMHSLIRLSFYSLRWRSYAQSRHFEVKLVEQTSIENFRQTYNTIINLLENSVTSSSHF